MTTHDFSLLVHHLTWLLLPVKFSDPNFAWSGGSHSGQDIGQAATTVLTNKCASLAASVGHYASSLASISLESRAAEALLLTSGCGSDF